MPTIPPPANTAKSPNKPVNQTTPPPPPPLSSSASYRRPNATLTAILFIVSLLILCGLVGFFLSKSTTLFKVAAPVLSNLPERTNQSTITIEGTGPKNATIDISSDSTSVSTQSDKDGKFSMPITTGNDGKVTFFAVARKRVFFVMRTSDRSNEVSTTVDKTAPNIRIVTLPKIVTSPNYTIKGNTSESSKITVTVNGKEYTTTTDKNNAFSLKITLKNGSNTVQVKATDQAGNETSTSKMGMTFATGSVYTPSGSHNGNSSLPNSSGILSDALNSAFARIVALVAVVIGGFGFLASSSVVWLYKTYKKN